MKHVLGVIRAHPLIFLGLLGTLAAHPQIVPELVTLAETPTIAGAVTFAKANQELVTTLFVQLVGDLKDHPELLTAMLDAVDAHQAVPLPAVA